MRMVEVFVLASLFMTAVLPTGVAELSDVTRECAPSEFLGESDAPEVGVDAGEVVECAETAVGHTSGCLIQHEVGPIECLADIGPTDAYTQVTPTLVAECKGEAWTSNAGQITYTAGGNIKGFEFGVSYTTTVAKKTHYKFDCTAVAMASARCWGGFLRECMLEGNARWPSGPSENGGTCSYTGLPGSTSCSFPAWEFGDDLYQQQGTVKKGGELPRKVLVCPPSYNWVMSKNYGYQELVQQPVVDNDAWSCKEVGISGMNPADVQGAVDLVLAEVGLDDEAEQLPEEIWED